MCRLVILLMSVAMAGCTTMGLRTSGVTGPVSWQATELQWQPEVFETQEIYTFTLVLHETQGTDMLFTKIHAILRNASQSRPAYWEKTGQWSLPARGELRLPLGSRRWCPYVKCWHAGPAFAPVWDITLTGTDQKGQPVQLTLDLRLPYVPDIVGAH